jgi:hypothetical protein
VRKELFADNRIDEIEMEFLLELRNGARSVAMSYNQLVFDTFKNFILADGGVISPNKVSWLRRWVLINGKADWFGKKILQEVKSSAKQVCKEFDTLYQQGMAS